MYPVFSVPAGAEAAEEQVGTKEKFWFQLTGDPSRGTSESTQQLFKFNRTNCGDDWSEKIACEICRKLGIPHAHYDLATHLDSRGVVTPSVVPKRGRLILGNELLPAIFPEYPDSDSQRYKARQHTVGRVVAILSARDSEGRMSVLPPIRAKTSRRILTAVDFFVGYLMLDALISNQDRHHENWALILDAGLKLHLAPTFDHAASLGTTEGDEKRKLRLETNDPNAQVSAYVKKARSAFYKTSTDQRPLTTLDAFKVAAKGSRQAASAWLSRLKRLSAQEVDRVLLGVPNGIMSDVAKRFAREMILCNKSRLLAVKEVLQ